MNVPGQIEDYIASLPEPKRAEMRALHELAVGVAPSCRLWFLDGKDDNGKIVSNPSIGYGLTAIAYANGTSREFYRIGLSANTTGISIYVMDLDDEKHLASTYGARLGKTSISGYCIKFRKLADVNLTTLEEVFRANLAAQA